MERYVNEKPVATYRSRVANQYKLGLFPDTPTGYSLPDFAIHLLRGKELQRVHGQFVFFNHKEGLDNPHLASLKEVKKSTGGQKVFFNDGEKVLDIGAGAAVALAQLSAEHPKVGFVALEKGYSKNIEPAFKEYGNYVGGDWNFLPFKDDSFTRIMSVESFPKHAEWIWDFKQTFRDITRISKAGTIWRGTHLGLRNKETAQESEWISEMLQSMTTNGWDVFVSNRIFVAKLISKK